MASARRMGTGGLVAIVALLAALAAIALLVARPARVVGVGEGELAFSLARAVDGELGGCDERKASGSGNSAWRCHVEDARGKPVAIYAVDAGAWGCWEAERAEGLQRTAQASASACIWLRDYVRLD